MMAAAARSFAIRDSAYATSSRVRNPDLDILPYAFRFETFAFYSNRVWASHSIPLFPSSFSRPPLFSLLWSPVLPLFLSFFIPRLPLLSSSSSLSLPFVLDSPSSSSSRLARIRGTRGKFRKGESEERTKGRTSTHTATLFACITAIYSRGGRDPFTRVRASEKRFENLHEGGTDGGGRREQRRHAAKAKICARSRYVLASIVRNFDGRERERERSITR